MEDDEIDGIEIPHEFASAAFSGIDRGLTLIIKNCQRTSQVNREIVALQTLAGVMAKYLGQEYYHKAEARRAALEIAIGSGIEEEL